LTRAALLSLLLLWAASGRASGQVTVRPANPSSAPVTLPAAGPAQSAPATPAAMPGVQSPTETSVPGPQIIGWIRSGQSRTGQLEAGDYRMGDGTLADVWYFDGAAGQRIAVALRTQDYDGYMQLLDPFGAKLAETSAHGGHDVELTFQLPAAGRYQIVVNSAGSDVHLGPYTLGVKAGPAPRAR
jgi:hypothetical protein